MDEAEVASVNMAYKWRSTGYKHILNTEANRTEQSRKKFKISEVGNKNTNRNVRFIDEIKSSGLNGGVVPNDI